MGYRHLWPTADPQRGHSTSFHADAFTGAIRFAGLEVVSFGESAVADEGAGDAGEGQEVFGLAFI
ncbi:hypothetical protein ACIO8F_41805, partial [Streptomyces sp. NPDC087228]|uniref:hypothetical protein n=1 Tax=Streptomyces sp. NPDC087228 TaxID=3365772 RepID=UPI00381A9FFB